MEKMKLLSGIVFFRYKNFKVTLRDVGIVVILLLLLFSLVKCRRKDSTDVSLKKAEAIQETCSFSKHNLNALQVLLERSDLCSEQWFNDYQDYMSRLKEQNELLKPMESKSAKEIYSVQLKLLEALENFYNQQNETHLNQLKEKVEAYQEMYHGLCKGEGLS